MVGFVSVNTVLCGIIIISMHPTMEVTPCPGFEVKNRLFHFLAEGYKRHTIAFGCQYQCSGLPGKTRLQNDLP